MNFGHRRDQLLRASQSIPGNIAEGNGKGIESDRRRYFVPSQRRHLPIARGSALECAAIQEILVVCGVIESNEGAEAMRMLHRVGSMLTTLGKRECRLDEGGRGYLDNPAPAGTTIRKT